MSQVIVATCLTSWWPSEGRLRAFAGVEVVALACAPGSSPLSSKSSHQLKDLGLDVDRRHASKSWRSRKAPDLDVDGRHVPKCYCRKWLKHVSGSHCPRRGEQVFGIIGAWKRSRSRMRETVCST